MSEWEDHDREFIEKVESSPEIRCSRSKHWRLMKGALVTNKEGIPARVLKVEKGRALLCTGLDMFWADDTPSYYFPVLSDPATIGCLRHQAAEAHGAWDIVIQVDIRPRMEGTHGWWRAIDSRGRKIQGAFGTFVCPNDGTDIKALALVEALEAAE